MPFLPSKYSLKASHDSYNSENDVNKEPADFMSKFDSTSLAEQTIGCHLTERE